MPITQQQREERAAAYMAKEAQILTDKQNNSAAAFKNTKVTSCSKILSKNGQAVCLAFSNGAAKPIDLSTKRSSETKSLASEHFKHRETLHAGMAKKPLEPYHPNSFRNRLPQPTVVMPYKNSSTVVIGDRSTYNKRQFVSTQMNSFVKPRPFETSNSGIVADITSRWKHAASL